MSKLKKKILYTNLSKVSDLNQTYKENFIIFLSVKINLIICLLLTDLVFKNL